MCDGFPVKTYEGVHDGLVVGVFDGILYGTLNGTVIGSCGSMRGVDWWSVVEVLDEMDNGKDGAVVDDDAEYVVTGVDDGTNEGTTGDK